MLLSGAASTATAALERCGVVQKASSFVTFSTDPTRRSRWGLAADVRIMTPDQPHAVGAVEANLQNLTRDFGACDAIPLHYGQDFFDRCSQILADFWRFDTDIFPLSLIGIPPWAPFQIMRKRVAARRRFLEGTTALYRRIDQYQCGETVESGVDMSDISKVALERRWVYSSMGEASKKVKPAPDGDRTILHAFRQPALEINSMILPGLFANCPLLKASIFEIYRMANEAASSRYVARPVTIDDGAYKHDLRPGMFISAPHPVNQRDPLVYPNPDRFLPDRFLEIDPEAGKSVPRYGKLRPRGTDAAMCKGRTFAEREIKVLGAAIISLWISVLHLAYGRYQP
ncbi:hypothetical protein LTR33_003838 [Friedmanniomyces endolithicus]|nr:hypothetical protein LTR33_003838 [Friedmanniomyces endolithicus]